LVCHAVPLSDIERVRWLADIDAGIVDEDVDPAELAGDAADHGGDRFLVGDVGGDRNRLGAALLKLRDRSGRLGFVAAHHRDRRAGFCQSPGHAKPDAAIAARDDGYLAGEIEGSCCHGCLASP
jgi:hypothetical protein